MSLAATSYQFGESVLNPSRIRSHEGGNHANDRHYSTLRDNARSAQAKHAHFAAEASKAYKRGDKAEASDLSSKSKQYEAEADRLNQEAASWVFMANNTDSAADEIDLHGLFVKEALIALDARLNVCKEYHQPLLKAIVGKGLHSETHIAKLRPAVIDHCNQQGLPNEIDKHNPGVVLIHAGQGSSQGYSRPQQPLPGGYAPPPNQGYQQQQYQSQHQDSSAGYSQHQQGSAVPCAAY